MTGVALPVHTWTADMVEARSQARRPRLQYTPDSLDARAATVWSNLNTSLAARRAAQPEVVAA